MEKAGETKNREANRRKNKSGNGNAKARATEDKWERRKYLLELDSKRKKDVIKIILHIWQVSCNNKRDNTNAKCPFCQKIRGNNNMCQNVEKIKSSHKGEWKEITEIYRKNKKKKEVAGIQVQDQDKIIKEN